MTDPTIPDLVARLRELHEKLQALQVGTPEFTAARQLFRDALQLSAPGILDALDHVGDAAAHSPDGGKEEGEPGFLSSDGVCPFCNCYADTPHTWRDCAHDLRERTQGLQERTDRLERDYAAANSTLREALAAFRLKVSEALGCTKLVHGVTPEPFTVAASDDVALGAIRDLKERSTWVPIEECGELEEGAEYLVRMKRGVLEPLITIARWTGAEWRVRIADVERYDYRAEHITHLHEMGPIRGPGEG